MRDQKIYGGSKRFGLQLGLDVNYPFCDISAGNRDSLMVWRSVRSVVLAAAFAALLAVSGCAPMDLRGNGFGDESATWGQKFRAPTQSGNLLGFDSRAREIEQNVGVR